MLAGSAVFASSAESSAERGAALAASASEYCKAAALEYEKQIGLDANNVGMSLKLTNHGSEGVSNVAVGTIAGKAGPACIVEFGNQSGCAEGYILIFEALKDGAPITASSFNNVVVDGVTWEGHACKQTLVTANGVTTITANAGNTAVCVNGEDNLNYLTKQIQRDDLFEKYGGNVDAAKCNQSAGKALS